MFYVLFFLSVANQSSIPRAQIYTKNSGKFATLMSLPSNELIQKRNTDFLIREFENFIQTTRLYMRQYQAKSIKPPERSARQEVEPTTTTTAPEDTTTTIAPETTTVAETEAPTTTTTVAPEETTTTTVAPEETTTTTVVPEVQTTTTIVPEDTTTTTVAPEEPTTTTIVPEVQTTTTTIAPEEITTTTTLEPEVPITTTTTIVPEVPITTTTLVPDETTTTTIAPEVPITTTTSIPVTITTMGEVETPPATVVVTSTTSTTTVKPSINGSTTEANIPTEESLDYDLVFANKLPPIKDENNYGIRPNPDEFQWHVLLVFANDLTNQNGSSIEITCGGAIVGWWSIVTAASCAYDLSSGAYMARANIYFGLMSNSVVDNGPPISANLSLVVNTNNTIIHPLYLLNNNLSSQYNLAVIHLPERIDFKTKINGFSNSSVKMMKSMPKNSWDNTSDAAFIPVIQQDTHGYLEFAGYGRNMETNQMFYDLRFYRAVMTSLVECRSIFVPNVCLPGIITTTNRNDPMSNACSVEMGAPLTLSASMDDHGLTKSSVLVGILTFGTENGCSGGNHLSGFVSIPFNYAWLMGNVK